VPDAQLLAEGVEPWTDFPLWIPEDDPEVGVMMTADATRAVAAGLRFRPLEQTIRATLEWDRAEGAQPTERPILNTAISPAREAELLAGVRPAGGG
jgi:hypothetical protein